MGPWIDYCLLDKYVFMQYLPPKYKHVLCFRKDDLFLLWSSKWYILANKCVCVYIWPIRPMKWLESLTMFFSVIFHTRPHKDEGKGWKKRNFNQPTASKQEYHHQYVIVYGTRIMPL